jgi:hypothetical protein
MPTPVFSNPPGVHVPVGPQLARPAWLGQVEAVSVRAV